MENGAPQAVGTESIGGIVPYYVPPPEGPNPLAAFWHSFLATRSPWANKVFLDRLESMKPVDRTKEIMEVIQAQTLHKERMLQIQAGMAEAQQRYQTELYKVDAKGAGDGGAAGLEFLKVWAPYMQALDVQASKNQADIQTTQMETDRQRELKLSLSQEEDALVEADLRTVQAMFLSPRGGPADAAQAIATDVAEYVETYKDDPIKLAAIGRRYLARVNSLPWGNFEGGKEAYAQARSAMVPMGDIDIRGVGMGGAAQGGPPPMAQRFAEFMQIMNMGAPEHGATGSASAPPMDDLTRSGEAEKAGLDNTPGDAERAALERTWEHLEPVLQAFPGAGINSGYRSPEVNGLIKGAATHSDHMDGTAVDLQPPPGVSPDSFAAAIDQMGLPVDKLIWYADKGHVHVSFSDNPRRLTRVSQGGKLSPWDPSSVQPARPEAAPGRSSSSQRAMTRAPSLSMPAIDAGPDPYAGLLARLQAEHGTSKWVDLTAPIITRADPAPFLAAWKDIAAKSPAAPAPAPAGVAPRATIDRTAQSGQIRPKGGAVQVPAPPAPPAKPTSARIGSPRPSLEMGDEDLWMSPELRDALGEAVPKAAKPPEKPKHVTDDLKVEPWKDKRGLRKPDALPGMRGPDTKAQRKSPPPIRDEGLPQPVDDNKPEEPDSAPYDELIRKPESVRPDRKKAWEHERTPPELERPETPKGPPLTPPAVGEVPQTTLGREEERSIASLARRLGVSREEAARIFKLVMEHNKSQSPLRPGGVLR